MNWFEKKLTVTQPIVHKTVTFKGCRYEVYFMNPAVMEEIQSFGHIVGKSIYIKAGLPEKVERFVIQHEIYHLNDKRTWLGWLGKELRANVVCGVRDPAGLTATVRASLNRPRLNAYWRTLRHVGIKQV